MRFIHFKLWHDGTRVFLQMADKLNPFHVEFMQWTCPPQDLEDFSVSTYFPVDVSHSTQGALKQGNMLQTISVKNLQMSDSF